MCIQYHSFLGSVVRGFAYSVQMLTSAPLVMVAVATHVPTPLAPTTAPVILGTDWITTGSDVTVSEWNVLASLTRQPFLWGRNVWWLSPGTRGTVECNYCMTL